MSGNIGSTTLTTNQIPSHSHPTNVGFGTGGNEAFWTSLHTSRRYSMNNNLAYATTSNTGNGGSHNHNHNLSGSLTVNSSTFSGTAKDLAVQYVDTIIATKD